jgi:hypothetical protein
MSEVSGISAAVMGAAIPADVRAEGSGAVKGYRAALEFESMLLKQMLTEALPENPAGTTAGGEGEGEAGGEGGSTSFAPTLTDLPETVTESILSAGGLGLAKQMYSNFEGGAK